MKMRILSIIPHVVFVCSLFLNFVDDISAFDVIGRFCNIISTQGEFFNVGYFYPIALPFLLLIFILFVKSTMTTGICKIKYIRYPLYIIGIGLFLISCWFPVEFLFNESNEWGGHLFLAMSLVCLYVLIWLRRLKLTEAEKALVLLMLCYIPNTVICVALFTLDTGLQIGGYIALISVLYFIAEIARIVRHHRKSIQQIA